MLPLSDLETYERHAREDLKGNLGQQAAARKILALAEEVRRCWKLIEERATAAPTRLPAPRPSRCQLDATGPSTDGGKGKVSIE
jgi:hypothetical protein